MSDRTFVARTFEVGSKQVLCRFLQPVLDEGDYRCDIEIDWPEPGTSTHAYGVDEVQALLLAMQKVHLDLLAARHYRATDVTWIGGRSLGLPIPESARDWDPENSM